MQEQLSPRLGAVPITHLDLADLPEAERFAVWKESISVIFDVTLAADAGERPFTTQLTTCHLGSLLIANTVSPRQAFKRPPQLIARDGLDHFLVQVFRQGRNAGRFGKSHLDARPGDVMLMDLAQPLETRTGDQDSLTLVVPRRLFEQRHKSPERLHGRVLPKESPLGRLLGEHLRTLWRAAPTASAAEANIMAEGVAGLAVTYFGQLAPPGEAPDIDAALLLTMRQYIASHLADRQLGPEGLVARFQISRAQAYRLFQPFGGVGRYIQAQRLAWCRAELAKPANRNRRVIDIAQTAGFASESHFSRAFREAFGISPSEWRDGLRPDAPLAPEVTGLVDRRYEGWLRNLG
ncbi:AraC-like ligand-binding domain-containing protein [Methylomagnum sp.]